MRGKYRTFHLNDEVFRAEILSARRYMLFLQALLLSSRLQNADGDDFDFAAELARSRRQEDERDFEGACNTRLHAFQRLVDMIPEEGETVLEWEDEPTQAAVLTGYCSGIDHFLAGDWEMAAAIFEMLLDVDPEDHSAGLYLHRHGRV